MPLCNAGACHCASSLLQNAFWERFWTSTKKKNSSAHAAIRDGQIHTWSSGPVGGESFQTPCSWYIAINFHGNVAVDQECLQLEEVLSGHNLRSWIGHRSWSISCYLAEKADEEMESVLGLGLDTEMKKLGDTLVSNLIGVIQRTKQSDYMETTHTWTSPICFVCIALSGYTPSDPLEIELMKCIKEALHCCNTRRGFTSERAKEFILKHPLLQLWVLESYLGGSQPRCRNGLRFVSAVCFRPICQAMWTLRLLP